MAISKRPSLVFECFQSTDVDGFDTSGTDGYSFGNLVNGRYRHVHVSGTDPAAASESQDLLADFRVGEPWRYQKPQTTCGKLKKLFRRLRGRVRKGLGGRPDESARNRILTKAEQSEAIAMASGVHAAAAVTAEHEQRFSRKLRMQRSYGTCKIMATEVPPETAGAIAAQRLQTRMTLQMACVGALAGAPPSQILGGVV